MERSTRVFRFTALDDVAFQCPTRRCAMGCPLYLTRGLAVIEPDGMGASQVEQLHEELNMSYWPSGLVAATVQQIRSLKRSSFVPALHTPCSCTEVLCARTRTTHWIHLASFGVCILLWLIHRESKGVAWCRPFDACHALRRNNVKRKWRPEGADVHNQRTAYFATPQTDACTRRCERPKLSDGSVRSWFVFIRTSPPESMAVRGD